MYTFRSLVYLSPVIDVFSVMQYHKFCVQVHRHSQLTVICFLYATIAFHECVFHLSIDSYCRNEVTFVFIMKGGYAVLEV